MKLDAPLVCYSGTSPSGPYNNSHKKKVPHNNILFTGDKQIEVGFVAGGTTLITFLLIPIKPTNLVGAENS